MADELDYDLVVYDDDCKEIGKDYKKLADEFNTYLNTYSQILDRVINSGIKSGKVHNNLVKFSEAVKGLNGQIDDLANTANECGNDFVSDIDEADSYLY